MEFNVGFRVEIGLEVDAVVGEPETFKKEIAEAQTIVQWPKWVRKQFVDYVKSLRCFENVREMILTGIPSSEIARQVHLFGEAKDLQESSLTIYIDHYKATVPKGLILQRASPRHFNQLQKKVEKTVDVMEEFGKLYNMMYARIDLAYQREKTIGFILPNVEKNFVVALELLKNIQELQVKGGFAKEQEQIAAASRQIDWDRIYTRPGVNKVLQDPTARARVVRFVENMTSLFGAMPAEKQQEILDYARRKKEQEEPIEVEVGKND